MKRILATAIALALGAAGFAGSAHASPLPAGWTCTPALCGAPQGKPIVEHLLPPPEVPPPITRRRPATVIVNLEAKEVVGTLADGVQYDFYTFNGTVPGPMIRVRVGDTVEIRLKNAHGDHMPHNVDLHAVMGVGGGAPNSIVIPGHEAAFAFKALHAGLYVYHCAMAPAAVHIANGMYGAILVEPADGLPRVDKEFYVMQGEFYTKGAYMQPGLQPLDMTRLLDEQPTYVVFNGRVGSLTGEHALRAKEGQTVRFFFSNGGPNLTSSFHMIGGIWNTVWPWGGSNEDHNVQTISVPPGGSAIADVKLVVPGTFMLVDHAAVRMFNKGALGQLVVSGPEQPDLYRKLWNKPFPPAGASPAPAAASSTH